MTFPDGGRSYLSKFYDDNWMRQYGFIERRSPAPVVEEVLAFRHGSHEADTRARHDRDPPEGRRGDRR